jgi:hypothetical protein
VDPDLVGLPRGDGDFGEEAVLAALEDRHRGAGRGATGQSGVHRSQESVRDGSDGNRDSHWVTAA